MDQEQKSGIYEVELARWTELVGEGTHNAVAGFSEMVGVQIRITALDLTVVPVEKAPDMLGGAANEVVAIYVGIEGGATGHILLVYPINVALGLVDMMMGEEPGNTQELGEMEESALQEIGNVTGSFFLNSMADNTGIRLMPTPPTVMMDMAGSILDTALAEIMMNRDELFAMETVFSTDDLNITGTLLILPTADFMDVMIQQKQSYARVKWQ